MEARPERRHYECEAIMGSKRKHEDKTDPDRRKGVRPWVFPVREDGDIIGTCTAMDVGLDREVVITEWLDGEITCQIEEGNEDV